jgi:hypothetical protein
MAGRANDGAASLYAVFRSIWFSKIEREPLARGIFISVSDLARKFDDESGVTTKRRADSLEFRNPAASNW